MALTVPESESTGTLWSGVYASKGQMSRSNAADCHLTL